MMKKLFIWMFVMVFVMSTTVHGFSGAGAGTSGDPYQITTTGEWLEMANDLTAYYRVENNLDFRGVSYTSIAGTFTGNLDGQNYDVSNLLLTATKNIYGAFDKVEGTVANIRVINMTFANSTTYQYQGFIGHTGTGGTLSNINISDSVVFGNGRVALIVGQMTQDSSISDSIVSNSTIHGVTIMGAATGFVATSGSTITNVTVTDLTINMVSSTQDTAGGMVGTNRGNITKSLVDGLVINDVSNNDEVGGFAGETDSGLGNFEECAVRNAVINGRENVGGFIGWHTGGEIKNSYAYNVTVTGSANGVGGFVGEGNGEYINTYSAGSVTGSTSNRNTGGFGGELLASSSVTDSFTDTEVVQSGVNNRGIFVASIFAGSSVTGSYGNNRTDNPSNMCVDSTCQGNTITAVSDDSSWFYDNANAPISNWNYSTVWVENAADYPCLMFEESCGGVNPTPVVTIVNSSFEVFVSDAVEIAFSFDDDSPTANCTLYNNNTQKSQNVSTLEGVQTNLSTGVLTVGLNNIDVRCDDTVYEGEDSIVVTYTLPNNDINITNPDSYVVFQRDTATTGEVYVSGVYSGVPDNIQARLNGGAWTTIDSNPTGGTYAAWFNASVGNGTLEVRFDNFPLITDSVSNVGVGDVFVIAGQSNAVGRSQNNATLNASVLNLTTMYREDDVWAVATDPTDTQSPAGGSMWIPMLNYLVPQINVPVAIITTATGGSEIDTWVEGGSEYIKSIAQIDEATYSSNKIKAILWYQGESDAHNDNVSSYKTKLLNVTTSFLADTEIATQLVAVQINKFSTRANLDGIRQAIQESWDEEATIYEGAITYDILYSDVDVHYYTNAERDEVGRRMYLAVADQIYNLGSYEAPKLLSSSMQTETTSTVTLTFNKNLKIEDWTGVSSGLAKGFRVNDSGTIYDDTDVLSTTVNGSVVTVVFNVNITNSSLFYYASYDDVYDLAGLRDTTYDLPVRPVYDEILVEAASTPDVLPPIIDITDPINGSSFYKDDVGIVFTAIDLEGNLDRCVVDLYYSNDTYITELMNVASGGSYAVDWTVYDYDNYYINVTCNDTSSNVDSNLSYFTIADRPASISSVSISPSILTNASATATGACVASDPDGDNITYAYEWAVDGVNQSHNSLTFNVSGLNVSQLVKFYCVINGGVDIESTTTAITSAGTGEMINIYTCPADRDSQIIFGIFLFTTLLFMAYGFFGKDVGSAILGLIASLCFVGLGIVFVFCSNLLGGFIVAIGLMSVLMMGTRNV